MLRWRRKCPPDRKNPFYGDTERIAISFELEDMPPILEQENGIAIGIVPYNEFSFGRNILNIRLPDPNESTKLLGNGIRKSHWKSKIRRSET